jgi:hypothetical protein
MATKSRRSHRSLAIWASLCLLAAAPWALASPATTSRLRATPSGSPLETLQHDMSDPTVTTGTVQLLHGFHYVIQASGTYDTGSFNFQWDSIFCYMYDTGSGNECDPPARNDGGFLVRVGTDPPDALDHYQDPLHPHSTGNELPYSSSHVYTADFYPPVDGVLKLTAYCIQNSTDCSFWKGTITVSIYGAGGSPTPSLSPSPSISPTASASPSPSASPSVSPSPSPSPSASPSATPLPSPTQSPPAPTAGKPLTVPAHGSGTAKSSKLPPTADRGFIDVSDTSDDAKTFDRLTEVMTRAPNRTSRILVCLRIIQAEAATPTETTKGENYWVADDDLLALFLHACIRLAIDLPIKAGPQARSFAATSTTRPCLVTQVEVAVRIKHVNGTFRMHVRGKPHPPATKDPAVSSCQVKGRHILISRRPRKKGKTLRQVVGPRLAIGFVNRGATPIHIRTAFRVK